MNSRKRGKKRSRSRDEVRRIILRVTALVLTAVVLFMAYKLSPHYVNHYSFKGAMQQEIIDVSARAVFDENSLSDETIRGHVIGAARRNNIILEENSIQITRIAGNVEISVNYTITVNFLIMEHNLHFEVKENRHFL